ncbi:MAG: TonB-dependent receptor plug domain-containing protein [Opitutaceae bacterium]|nr:TonB-dependent receptor plug domain-containing protein [Opitutaceae bacterium]
MRPVLRLALVFTPFAILPIARGQAAAPLPPTAAAAKNSAEVVALNPFEVKAEADNSYGALNSNSLTQFNTALSRTPVSADIFTAEFMRDIAATSVEEMLNGYGAGAGTVMSNPDSDALNQQPGDRVGNQTIGIRGTGGGAIRRDGFAATGAANNFGSTAVGITSTFDVERADVVRGPQGLLYGAGGAGGTVNTVSKRAMFNQRRGSASWRIDQFGSKQGQLDYNAGNDWLAFRVALLDDAQRYRRLFIGYETQGFYGQFAVNLPAIRTVVRVQAQQTVNERILNTNQENIAFTNAATDPRHNYGLPYLLRNGLAGAVNPATGQPWPRGAIANGQLTWDNLNAWAGWAASEYVTNKTYAVLTETVWTKWLSTQFNVLYNDYQSDRANGGIANLSAPLLNGNPLNEWANGATLSDVEQPTRRWAARGAAMITKSLFGDRAATQTLLGYDIEWADSGPTDYGYFLADQNFNVVYDPRLPTNLGRTPMPRIWWSVANGPQKKPMPRGGWVSPRLTFAGQNYVRMPNNPRDPAWVRPNNPLGLAQLAGLAGVSGQNNDGHNWENRTAGFYASNYTSWFGDRFATLIGVRSNENLKRTPNITATFTEPWAVSTQTDRSYNLGLNARLTDTLRPFYSFSSTYNVPLVNANDPLGNAPRTSSATGHEAGLKFTTRDGRYSGSVQYFATNSKDEMINAGGGVRDLINPTGLNGAHNGPAGAKNQWTNLDRTTSGLEVILTASPTPNWRLRLAATSADGKNLTDKKYPLLWNDQFHVRGGTVTYQNGTPVTVPVTPTVIAANIATLNRQIDPATIQNQGEWQPLTLAMMNDRNSPYWAQPADDNGRLQTSNVRRVLQYFVGANGTALTGVTGLPVSQIPYAWSDPFGSKGETVVAKKGESTVGYAQYRFVLTNNYTFTGDNFLKGFGVGGTVALGLKNRTFYYNTPGGGRERFGSPDTWQVNLVTSYRRKLGKRFLWTTQVNIDNAFNHYVLGTLPNNGSGFTVPANLAVTFYGQPRSYVWTNSVSF